MLHRINFGYLALGLLEQEIFEIIFNSLFSVADVVGESGNKSAILVVTIAVAGGDCAGFFGSQCFVPEAKTFASLLLGRSIKFDAR